MNAFSIMAFLQEYPGVMAMITRFPTLRPGTKDLLVAFLKKAAESHDPEEFLVSALKYALKTGGRAEPITVEVINTRVLPKKRR
jgi:hypothetical protein